MYNGMMTESEYLEQAGVKGMKWGKRKAEEKSSETGGSASDIPKPKVPGATKLAASTSGSTSARINEYMKTPPPKLSESQQANAFADNQKKFSAKFEDSSKPPKVKTPYTGWRPSNKQIVYGVVGAAAVGAILYGGYKYGKYVRPLAGTKVDSVQFNAMVSQSKMTSWTGSGYIKPSSFSQQEFTLKAGHTFNRISTAAETKFGSATYATHSVDDFNRYVSAFRKEKGTASKLYHVTFKATEDIKVPDLLTRLDTMRETMTRINGKEVSPEVAKLTYQSLSGGSWNGSVAKAFFEDLGKKGFGAIVDDMDAGVIGESPLVVFSNSSFSAKESMALTQEAIKLAESNLSEFINRK